MSEPVDSIAEVPEVAPPELPGGRLRQGREAKGLTTADIAQALKFSARQIEALEANDYSILPGVTFIRGAVRSYAKFLKLDAAPLLAMLDATAPAAPPDVRPPQNMGAAQSNVGVRQISPLVAASVLLMVVAVVIGAWHMLGGPQSAPTGNGKPAAATTEAETVQPVMPPQAKIEQPTAEMPPAAAPATGPAAATAFASAAAPVSSTPAPPPPAPSLPDGRQLLFVFGEKSWIEVKDASQRVVFTGEQPAGSRQAIVGKPPFQLVIGNAGKVQVFDGERQVDLQPYIRAEVARLTLE